MELIEESKLRKQHLIEKLRFVIKSLTDKDASYLLMAYNGMKQRKLQMGGVGLGDDVATKLKIRLLRKLTDTGFNLQTQASVALKEFLASERDREERERLEFERQQREKDRILRRVMDSNVRMMGTGFRQAFQWMESEREKEIALMRRQRGIMRRIVDSNVRLMSAGYNKLLEEWKAKNNALKEKLRFVIASLTDKDKQFTLMAYNGLKQRSLMLSGVGMGDAEMKKIQLIKRLTNQGYNLQVMAANALQEFLASEKKKERQLIFKQRGIMNRMVDSNVRLMGAGFNKLIEEWKAKNNMLKDKLKFVIKTLTDQDAAFMLAGYNGLKQRAMMLNGVGMGDSEMKKIQLIKRLTNKGYNLQVMAANALKEFLASERDREEKARLEYERQQKEKDRILRRIMDGNVRMMGTGFRQSYQWMES